MTNHDKFQVVDNWMMLLRSEEEVLQSEKEMQNYVHSVSDQITLLEREIKKNVLLRDTSTPKEMKIAQQKMVLASAEKDRLHQMLVLAVSKFKEIKSNFIEVSNTFVSLNPLAESGFKDEDEEEDFSADDEEQDNFDENQYDDWSDEESNSDEDNYY